MHKKATLTVRPENQWLKDESPFGVPPVFRGMLLLLVSGRVDRINMGDKYDKSPSKTPPKTYEFVP